MSRDTTPSGRKEELLEKMGLRKSKNFGKLREKVWRPKRTYLDNVRSKWDGHADVTESGIRKAKALAAQRNRGRRK